MIYFVGFLCFMIGGLFGMLVMALAVVAHKSCPEEGHNHG